MEEENMRVQYQYAAPDSASPAEYEFPSLIPRIQSQTTSKEHKCLRASYVLRPARCLSYELRIISKQSHGDENILSISLHSGAFEVVMALDETARKRLLCGPQHDVEDILVLVRLLKVAVGVVETCLYLSLRLGVEFTLSAKCEVQVWQ
jgi:hypothetical protein